MPLLPEDALKALPKGLREELLKALQEIIDNFRESRWEPAELNGGKLCEVIYSVLRGFVDGSFPAKAQKPPNMVDACRKLEQSDSSTVPRSIRIQIPRMIMALYEVRNNRGVGHVGGDVDPNHMDAVAVLQLAKWMVAELVRIFHDVSTEEATTLVDGLVEREIPLVWEVGGKKRVLSTTLSMREKTFVLLYGHPGGLQETALTDWLEHSNPSVYRRDILVRAHKARLLEYDKASGLVTLSPKGVDYVEGKRLLDAG